MSWLDAAPLCPRCGSLMYYVGGDRNGKVWFVYGCPFCGSILKISEDLKTLWGGA